MPKAEKGTPKDIANRMKAKGLQKLKYYCQMCSKQCRDENGFQCHLASDSHLRQMQLFCSNSTGMLDQFSSEFESVYLDTLYRRHRTKRMNANVVYQEVIQDKHHVHMNATKWVSLGDFVQYLGKSGRCVVEETERGWYVTYIERDPTILKRQEEYKKRVESEKVEEIKVAKRMEAQRMEAAKLLDRAGFGVNVQASNMNREDGGATVAMKLGTTSKSTAATTGKGKKKNSSIKSVFGDDDSEDDQHVMMDNNENDNDNTAVPQSKPSQPSTSHHQTTTAKRKRSSTQDDNQQPQNNTSRSNHDTRKQQQREDSHDDDRPKEKKEKKDKHTSSSSSSSTIQSIRKKKWIQKHILIRIISKKSKYYKRKGIINKVLHGNDDDRHDEEKKTAYMAQIEILDSGPRANDGGKIIKLDQNDLETVVPKVGKEVTILNGRGRGERAVLVEVDDDKCRAILELVVDGTVLRRVHFDDFSKAA